MRDDGHGMAICTYADKTPQLQSEFKFKETLLPIVQLGSEWAHPPIVQVRAA
jgi:hypothetical protein